MKTEIDRRDPPDITVPVGDGESAFDAWTLEELEDDLGSLRVALTGTDDALGS